MSDERATNRVQIPPKESPDVVDLEIAFKIADGWDLRRLAAYFCMAYQSVAGRVEWMKAKRWMTCDRRLLSPDERDRLIEIERQIFQPRKESSTMLHDPRFTTRRYDRLGDVPPHHCELLIMGMREVNNLPSDVYLGNDVSIYIADEFDSRAVGFMLVREAVDGVNWYAWIQTVYVDHGYRNLGVAQRLFKHVIDDVSKKIDGDAVEIAGGTQAKNAAMIAAFRKAGFRHNLAYTGETLVYDRVVDPKEKA